GDIGDGVDHAVHCFLTLLQRLFLQALAEQLHAEVYVVFGDGERGGLTGGGFESDGRGARVELDGGAGAEGEMAKDSGSTIVGQEVGHVAEAWIRPLTIEFNAVISQLPTARRPGDGVMQDNLRYNAHIIGEGCGARYGQGR